MKRILYGFFCEFSRTSFWPFRERQWTREELLAITSVLSFLLLLALLLFILSRRWKKAIRAVSQERLATGASDGDSGLFGLGNREDFEAYRGRFAAAEAEQQRNKSHRRAAKGRKDKIRYVIQVATKGPQQMLAELAEDIRDLNLQNETSNRPDAKLDAALKALETGRAGNKEAAIEALGGLIDVVERERRDDDMVQQNDAEDLIDAAREIIKLLR